MAAENVLVAQIIALEKNIERMNKMLGNQELNYRTPISGKFLRVISPPKTRLMRLKKNVHGRQLTSAELQWSWGELEQIKEIVQRVFNQCLDYIGGIAVRKWGLEENICDVAETLVSPYLKQGASWVSVTIMGEERLLDDVAQQTQIIRLRFPEWDIWSLPFTAYEFGRWILGETYIERRDEFFENEQERLKRLIQTVDAQQLVADGELDASDIKDGKIQGLEPDNNALRQSSLAGEDVSERLQQKLDQQRAYLKEFFADAFGTYFLGPAYLYARVCLRLDPTKAFEDKPNQPSLARRIDLMFGVLAKMSELAKGGDRYASDPYEPEVKLLKELWEKTIQMVQPGYNVMFSYGKPYDRWAETLYSKLEETYIGVGFSHKDWKAVESLGKQFLAQEEPTTDASTSVPIVLNAAWYCRAREPERVPTVERQAHRLMRDISGRPVESPHQATSAKPGAQTQP